MQRSPHLIISRKYHTTCRSYLPLFCSNIVSVFTSVEYLSITLVPYLKSVPEEDSPLPLLVHEVRVREPAMLVALLGGGTL